MSEKSLQKVILACFFIKIVNILLKSGINRRKLSIGFSGLLPLHIGGMAFWRNCIVATAESADWVRVYVLTKRKLGMRELDMKEIKISVLLADDHPGMISGIKHELSSIESIHLKSSASNSTELIEKLEAEYFDVLVSDYSMPAGSYGDGLALFGYISRRFPNIGIVILTMLDNPAIYRSLSKMLKVSIVSKSDSLMHLLPAIHAAYTDGVYHSPAVMARMDKMAAETGLEKKAANFSLSPRESEVLRLYASGLRIDDIAAKLSRSKKTISAQKIKAMQKLGIERDIELMKYALECGWTGSSEDEADDGS